MILKPFKGVFLQVYFKMLDAFLAEEKIPDEHHDRNQVHRVVYLSWFIIGTLLCKLQKPCLRNYDTDWTVKLLT